MFSLITQPMEDCQVACYWTRSNNFKASLDGAKGRFLSVGSKTMVSKTQKSKRFRWKAKKKPKAKRCGATPNPKIIYADKEAAEMKMRYLRTLYSKDSRRLPNRVYRCPLCKKWHLTSSIKYSTDE